MWMLTNVPSPPTCAEMAGVSTQLEDISASVLRDTWPRQMVARARTTDWDSATSGRCEDDARPEVGPRSR